MGVLLGALVASIPGCGGARTATPSAGEGQRTTERYEYARLLMGTRCRIVVYASAEAEAAEACSAAFDRIADLEAVMSDYRPDSEAATVLGFEPGVWHPISEDLAQVLRQAEQVWRDSNGAFDPAVGPLTKLWRATRRSGLLPDASTLADARARSGLAYIDLDHPNGRIRIAHRGMGLDFGGIGKGHAADAALAVLADRGLPRALIDFGGDLVAGDPPPGEPRGWALQVRDGLGAARAVRLANAAMATSGDLEQFVVIDGVRYAHIVDPRTGLGLTRRTAATVIADQGWKADALASAACVMGEEGVKRLRRAYPEAMIEVITVGD